jgi:hypothetical protein
MGEANVCGDMAAALDRARELMAAKKSKKTIDS